MCFYIQITYIRNQNSFPDVSSHLDLWSANPDSCSRRLSPAGGSVLPHKADVLCFFSGIPLVASAKLESRSNMTRLLFANTSLKYLKANIVSKRDPLNIFCYLLILKRAKLRV